MILRVNPVGLYIFTIRERERKRKGERERKIYANVFDGSTW